MNWRTARLSFATAHPTAAGHFPGNPMIPGAALLDEVIVAIAGDDCDAPMRIRSAKFLHVVRPGDSLDLRWQDLPDGGITFECRTGGALAMTGRLEFAAAGS